MVDEDGVLQTWKSDHQDIAALVPLEDTETHKLRAVTDKLISHLPTYRGLGLKSAKDISEWCAPLLLLLLPLRLLLPAVAVLHGSRLLERAFRSALG